MSANNNLPQSCMFVYQMDNHEAETRIERLSGILSLNQAYFPIPYNKNLHLLRLVTDDQVYIALVW